MDWLQAPDYWLTRLVIERALGVTYCIAFLVAVNQFRPDRAGLAADTSLPLAGISSRVWGGPDQAARRPVLAKPDVPLLPPRDPAHAQPAELVLSSPA